MGYSEFDDLGEKIQNIIDQAVDEKNYQKLSKTITQTVNKAIDNGSDALKDALRGCTNYRTESSGWDYRQNRSWDVRQKEKKSDYEKYTQKRSENSENRELSLYAPSTGIKVKGVLMTTFGGILTGTFGTVALTFGAIGLASGSVGLEVTSIILAAFTAASGILLGNGCTSLSRLKRRKKYIQELGSHTYCDFQRLSKAVGKPVKFVKKDIKRMISKGWFLQGHVDEQETCLITSDETYDQYVSTQRQLEERQKLDAQRLSHREEKEDISPEVQQVLDKGNDFLNKIRRSNDAIPGEEISRKISRMELIVGKIFEQVKKHPEIVSDLNRLMDYYLPMTVKLLNAYEEMDSQPVQGENITSSKKEIEKTIDTLNTAFEKLLDSVFEDTAMDVSSDISVLNTVLAQEGLAEDELTRMRKEARKQ